MPSIYLILRRFQYDIWAMYSSLIWDARSAVKFWEGRHISDAGISDYMLQSLTKTQSLENNKPACFMALIRSCTYLRKGV